MDKVGIMIPQKKIIVYRSHSIITVVKQYVKIGYTCSLHGKDKDSYSYLEDQEMMGG